MDFVSSMKAEIDALEASLRADPDPRMLKLQELRLLLNLYVPPAHPLVSKEAPRASHEDRDSGQKPGRKTSPERLEAIEATSNILRQMQEPVKTAELFDMITKMGIAIGGKDPQSNYSALLYSRDEFVSHGREGWTLKKNEAAGSPSQSGPTASKPALKSAH